MQQEMLKPQLDVLKSLEHFQDLILRFTSNPSSQGRLLIAMRLTIEEPFECAAKVPEGQEGYQSCPGVSAVV